MRYIFSHLNFKEEEEYSLRSFKCPLFKRKGGAQVYSTRIYIFKSPFIDEEDTPDGQNESFKEYSTCFDFYMHTA